MSNIYNDQIIDNFLDHHPDCQQYNSNEKFDFPVIIDCICNLAEERERKEDHQQMLREVENGN